MLENSFYSLAFEVGVSYNEDWITYSKEEREKVTAPFFKDIESNIIKLKALLTDKNPLKGDLIRSGSFPGLI